MERIKQIGRPKLQINEEELRKELNKYINEGQTATKTFNNLKIGKTSFYNLLKERGIKKC